MSMNSNVTAAELVEVWSGPQQNMVDTNISQRLQKASQACVRTKVTLQTSAVGSRITKGN